MCIQKAQLCRGGKHLTTERVRQKVVPLDMVTSLLQVHMQSPQACGSAGPSMQPLTWAAPFSAYTGQRHGASPATPTPSSSAAHSPVPMRSSYQPALPFAASPALQV